MGFRWEEKKTGRWNLKKEDAITGEAIDPLLTLIDGEYEEVLVEFADFTHTFNVELGTTAIRGEKAKATLRGVPSRVLTKADGTKVRVATAYDLMLAHYGVNRGFSGPGYPTDYDDASRPYTPAWQEQETGVDRNLAIRVAREWADTAEKTKGRCLFITGSGILHWYHGGSLTYRAEAVMGILTGCQGKQGGGFAHYVGTEKIRNFAAIGTIGGAADWGNVGRQQNSTSYFYFHTDQWRYDGMSLDPLWAPRAKEMPAKANHSADMNAVAVRNGWLPFYPQFDKRNPLDVVKDARAAGAKSVEEVRKWTAGQFKERKLKFALPNVDAPQNHPKVLWIYRGNLIGTSMRGHELNLKHMLGTHHNVLGGDERAKDMVKEIDWSTEAPLGKLDLIYNVNLRMDSSANYSDIVLPTAHWYEKHDVTCTDLHSFLHPFTPAHDPAWECKHDWEAFRLIAEKISELAKVHLPDPIEDLVMTALNTDTPDELAQPMGELRDWWTGESEPVAGKTFPNVNVVTRDYTKIHDKYTTLGPAVTKPNGYGAKGIKTDLAEVYEQLKESYLVGEKDGRPSLETAQKVCEVILRISPESDGELSYQIFKKLEERTGRAARPSGRARSRNRLPLPRSDFAAAAKPDVAALVGDRDQGAHLLSMDAEHRSPEAVPYADRTTGDLLRPSDVPRPRRGHADLQAAGGHGLHRRHRAEGSRHEGREGVPLHHAAPEMGHPQHVRRFLADAEHVPWRPDGLDQRRRRQGDRRQGQRLGRDLQRERHPGGARRRQPHRAARHVDRLSPD